ncbi:MAG TPA: DUF4118 domain-containing protein [Acidimicrobiales bacterium]|nr:DUF4118 domain-containing protein [Acidimicrobiales bacterium]
MHDDSSSSFLKIRLAYAAAVIMPTILGAALYPARGHLVPANLALLFVVCTAVIATFGQRGAAVVAAVASGLSFDYFCTVPYLTLQMSRASDVTTTLLLVVVGLIVGQLASSMRRARGRAGEATDRLERVHALGQQVAMGAEPAFMVAAVARELRDLLHLKDCRFTREPEAGIRTRIRGDGSVTIGELVWAAERYGLPTQRVALPIRSRGRVLGAFVLTPTPACPVDRERRVTAVALADELGSALGAFENDRTTAPASPVDVQRS